MNDKIKLLLKTLDTFSNDLVVEDTKVTTLFFNNEEGKLLNKYIKDLQHQLEEKEEQMNIMSEAFDELKHQKQDYTQINILEMKLEEKQKVINEAFNKIETLRMEKWAIMGTDIMEILEILERGKKC